MTECSATTSAGQPCESPALEGSDRCLFHDPTHRALSSRGGRVSQHADTPVSGLTADLGTAEGIQRTLEATARALIEGRIDRPRANAVAYLCGTAISGLKAFDYSKRIKNLEVRLGLRDTDEDATETEVSHGR